MYLFDVASRHMSWLAERQSVTAANIANADTPGYRAREAREFSDVLASTPSTLVITSPLHMQTTGSLSEIDERQAGSTWDTSHSGNNVSIESELMTAASTSRVAGLDTSLMRSFHRMLMTSVKV